MLNIRRISLGLAAFALCAASAAHADAPGDAWAAAKGVLPASPTVVLGVNFNTIKGSQIFQQLFPAFLQQAGDAKSKLDEFKADCGIDPFAALQGLVVVAEDNGGAVFMSSKGLDRSKVESCLQKMAAKDKKQLTIGKPDAQGVVSYSVDANDKFALAYLPKGVIVASDTPEHVRSYVTGHGVTAGSPTAKALGAVNTGAAVWFVANKEQEISPPGNIKMKAAYGTADLAAGNIHADIRIVTQNPKEATEFAKFANGQLDDAKKQGQIPPQMTNVMKTVKITPTGDEVQFKASMAEQEALSLIGMAMGGGAGGGGGAPPPPPPPPPSK